MALPLLQLTCAFIHGGKSFTCKLNHCRMNLFLWNMNIYLHFLSFLPFEVAQIIGSLLVKDSDLHLKHSKSRWHSNARIQGLTSHGINLVIRGILGIQHHKDWYCMRYIYIYIYNEHTPQEIIHSSIWHWSSPQQRWTLVHQNHLLCVERFWNNPSAKSNTDWHVIFSQTW